MANRQTTFLIKRSNVPGKIPPSSGLTSGELALNTADAILYTSGSTSNSILPIGWDRIHRTGDTMTGTLYAPTISATTISGGTFYGDGSNLTGVNNNYTYVSGATYSALTTDNVIGIDSSISATTIYLPNSVTSGRLRYDIKDIGLNSYTNNITFVADGSDTIIGVEISQTLILDADGGAIILFNTGNGTWLQM